MFVLRIHFAGTESSHIWPGYMEGALISGYRAAQEVRMYDGTLYYMTNLQNSVLHDKSTYLVVICLLFCTKMTINKI